MPQFVQLLTNTQHRIYGYILSVTSNCADADDLMQETTAVMWQKFDQFKLGTDFVAWGIAVARYAFLDYRKKNRGSAVRLNDEAIQAIESDARKAIKNTDFRLDPLKECVVQLKPKYRKILELRFFEGNSIKMIAERVGISDRSVFRTFSHVYNLLLNCVQKKLAGEP